MLRNKGMENYDPSKPLKFITYLDMNNLYGWKMSRYLPFNRFKWLKDTDNFDINSISEESPIGYNLEVDLECSDKLHVLHNDYPLALEKIVIPCDRLPDYCKRIADRYEIKIGDVKKLISNFGNKTNFVIYYKNLQLYLSLGMKLTKIKRF